MSPLKSSWSNPVSPEKPYDKATVIHQGRSAIRRAVRQPKEVLREIKEEYLEVNLREALVKYSHNETKLKGYEILDQILRNSLQSGNGCLRKFCSLVFLNKEGIAPSSKREIDLKAKLKYSSDKFQEELAALDEIHVKRKELGLRDKGKTNLICLFVVAASKFPLTYELGPDFYHKVVFEGILTDPDSPLVARVLAESYILLNTAHNKMFSATGKEIVKKLIIPNLDGEEVFANAGIWNIELYHQFMQPVFLGLKGGGICISPTRNLKSPRGSYGPSGGVKGNHPAIIESQKQMKILNSSLTLIGITRELLFQYQEELNAEENQREEELAEEARAQRNAPYGIAVGNQQAIANADIDRTSPLRELLMEHCCCIFDHLKAARYSDAMKAPVVKRGNTARGRFRTTTTNRWDGPQIGEPGCESGTAASIFSSAKKKKHGASGGSNNNSRANSKAKRRTGIKTKKIRSGTMNSSNDDEEEEDNSDDDPNNNFVMDEKNPHKGNPNHVDTVGPFNPNMRKDGELGPNRMLLGLLHCTAQYLEYRLWPFSYFLEVSSLCVEICRAKNLHGRDLVTVAVVCLGYIAVNILDAEMSYNGEVNYSNEANLNEGAGEYGANDLLLSKNSNAARNRTLAANVKNNLNPAVDLQSIMNRNHAHDHVLRGGGGNFSSCRGGNFSGRGVDGCVASIVKGDIYGMGMQNGMGMNSMGMQNGMDMNSIGMQNGMGMNSMGMQNGMGMNSMGMQNGMGMNGMMQNRMGQMNGMQGHLSDEQYYKNDANLQMPGVSAKLEMLHEQLREDRAILVQLAPVIKDLMSHDTNPELFRFMRGDSEGRLRKVVDFCFDSWSGLEEYLREMEEMELEEAEARAQQQQEQIDSGRGYQFDRPDAGYSLNDAMNDLIKNTENVGNKDDPDVSMTRLDPHHDSPRHRDHEISQPGNQMMQNQVAQNGMMQMSQGIMQEQQYQMGMQSGMNKMQNSMQNQMDMQNQMGMQNGINQMQIMSTQEIPERQSQYGYLPDTMFKNQETPRTNGTVPGMNEGSGRVVGTAGMLTPNRSGVTNTRMSTNNRQVGVLQDQHNRKNYPTLPMQYLNPHNKQGVHLTPRGGAGQMQGMQTQMQGMLQGQGMQSEFLTPRGGGGGGDQGAEAWTPQPHTLRQRDSMDHMSGPDLTPKRSISPSSSPLRRNSVFGNESGKQQSSNRYLNRRKSREEALMGTKSPSTISPKTTGRGTFDRGHDRDKHGHGSDIKHSDGGEIRQKKDTGPVGRRRELWRKIEEDVRKRHNYKDALQKCLSHGDEKLLIDTLELMEDEKKNNPRKIYIATPKDKSDTLKNNKSRDDTATNHFTSSSKQEESPTDNEIHGVENNEMHSGNPDLNLKPTPKPGVLTFSAAEFSGKNSLTIAPKETPQHYSFDEDQESEKAYNIDLSNDQIDLLLQMLFVIFRREVRGFCPKPAFAHDKKNDLMWARMWARIVPEKPKDTLQEDKHALLQVTMQTIARYHSSLNRHYIQAIREECMLLSENSEELSDIAAALYRVITPVY